MKNYLTLLILTFIEFILVLILYSLFLGFLFEIKISWAELTFSPSDFNFSNFIYKSINYFVNLIFMEKFKIFILHYLVIITYNLLLIRKIISSKIYISIIFFGFSFILFSFIFDKNFYLNHNLSSTINSLLSIILVSLIIPKLSNLVIKIN